MPKTNSSKPLVKIAQASKLLGVHKDTLRRWEKAGKIKVVRDQKGNRLYDISHLIKTAPAASASKVPTTEQLLKSASQQAQQSTLQSDLQPQLPTLDYAELSDQTISKDNKQTARRFYLVGTAFFLLLVTIGLGYIRVLSTQSKPQIITSLENKVLAAITSQPLVRINANLKVRGSLSVTNDINGLTIATDSAGFTLTSENGKLTVVGDVTLDQDLSSSSSPTFSSVNLSSTSNQLVFQSGGPAGTLTWTPTAARTVTLPDATTTLVGTDTTDTLKNKTIKSSDSNTISGSFTGITGLGTISTGEWQGTKIGLSYGGTGATSASGARTALGAAASGANSDITSLTGLTTALSETQGGTGQTTYTKGDVLYASAANTLTKLNIGTEGQALVVSATGIPSWSSTSSVTGIVNLQEEGSVIGSSVSTLNFKGVDFALSTSDPGTSTAPYISVDYTNSKITRSDQNETITGSWIFSSGNVGIGVSSAGAKLALNGGAYIWPTTTSIAAPANGLAVYGNVGIGTTSPTQALDVIGTGRFTTLNATSAIQLNGTSINTGGTLSNVAYLDTANVFTAANYIKGNLGIGTSSAAGSALQVNGGLALWPSTTAISLSSGASLGVSGNVGIGTTSPNYALDVVGSMNATTLYQNGVQVTGSQWTTTGSDIYYTTGNVGAGTSAPAAAFQVNNSINTPFVVTSAGNVGIGFTSPSSLLSLSSNLSGTPSTTGPYLSISGSTFTDNNSAASALTANMVFNSISAPTLAASNSSVKTNNASTLYIAGAPTAGTNQTINNAYALNIASGSSAFGGIMQLTSSANAVLGTAVQGAFTLNGNTYTYRRTVTVTNNDSSTTLPSGYEITLALSGATATDVCSYTRSDSNDIRMASSTPTEIARNITRTCATPTVDVVFQTQADIAASGTATYYLYYGNSALSSAGSTFEAGNTTLDNADTVGDWTSSSANLALSQETTTKQEGTGSVQMDLIGGEGGDGADGAVTFSSNTTIDTANTITGRSCADGGDAVNYSVTGLTSNTATLSSTPSSGCLTAGDEVLLINLQGTDSATTNVGKYEFLTIDSISTNTVTFTANKTNNYGDGANDTNIGTATSNQRVMLQRVPNYTNVTVNNGVTLNASAWDGTKGGVLTFKANGTVTVTGTISMVGKGYRGGIGGTNDLPGRQGESYNKQSTSTSTSANLGGGGGGEYGGAFYNGDGGGGGGYGESGTNGGDGGGGGAVASGGNTYGAANLTTLFMGSGGGGGGDKTGNPSGGAGGNGGGIILISATNTLTITGSITASGNNGTAGNSNGGGGGGGAGGSVKLGTATATLGTNLVTATAGNGGSGGGGGGAGGAGRIAILTDSTTGTTNPTYTALTESSSTYTATKTLSAATDLSQKGAIQLQFYSSRTGGYMNIEFSEDGSTWTQTNSFSVTDANTWETKTWDISGITGTSRDAVTHIRFKVTDINYNFTAYFDNILATASSFAGTAPSSSAGSKVLGDNALTLNAQGASAIRLNYDTNSAAGTGGLVLYDGSTNPLFTINSSGNLGLGTSVPGSKLSVIGNIGIGTSAAGAALQVNGGGLFGWGTASTSLSSGAIAAFNGNVGIGTTSPLAPLHTWGNGTTSALFLNGNVGIGFSSPNNLFTVGTGNQFQVNSSGAIAAVTGITTSGGYTQSGTNANLFTGNIGIGVSSAGAKLSVNGGTYIWPTTTSIAAPSNGLAVYGNVGIGTTSPSVALHAVGNARITGLVSCNTIDTDENGVLSCGSDEGGALTPWTSDIDADGYDLNDLSNILFRETTGAPAGSDVGLYRDNTGDLSANVLTGKTLNIAVNGTDEYNFSSSALELNSNNITGAGTITAATNDDADLGSNTLRWKDLYLGPGTLHIGTSTSDEYTLSFDTTNNRLGFNLNDSGPAEIVFDSSGDVGIGTTNPNKKLEIYSSTGGNFLATTQTTLPSTLAASAPLASIFSGSGNPSIQALATATSDYASSLILGEVYSAAASAFNFIKMTADADGTPKNVFTVRGDGALGINTDPGTFNVHVLPLGTSGQTSMALESYGIEPNYPVYYGRRARGVVGTPTAILAGDHMLVIGARGYDGSAWNTGSSAAIFFAAAEDFTTAAHGSYISFATTPIGSTTGSRAEGMRIDSNGSLNIGYPGQAAQGKLSVNGNVGIGTSAAGSKLSVIGNIGIGTSAAGAALQANGGLILWPSTTALSLSAGSGLGVSGNVGIGTTSPSVALHAVGNARITGLISCNTIDTDINGNLSCGTDEGGAGSQTPWTSDIDADGYDLNDLSNILFRETTGAPAGTDVGLYRDNTGDLSANVLTGKTLNIAVNGTDEYNFSSSALELNSNNITGASAITASGLLTLSSNNNALLFSGTTPSISSGGNLLGIFAGGNVGIGTTGNVYGGLTVRGAGTSTNITLQTYGSNLTQGLTVLDNGNVGIGTTGPSGLLHVAKLANDNPIYIDRYSSNNGHVPTIQLRTSQQNTIGNTATTIGNMYGRLEWYGNDGNGFQQSAYIQAQQGSSTATDANLTISAGASGTIFIDGSSGNIGINNVAPVAKLHLTGAGITTGVNILSTGAGGGGGMVGILDNGNVGIGTSAPSASFQVNTSTSNPFVVQSGGNVGIGTTFPNALLEITGTAGNELFLTDVRSDASNGVKFRLRKANGTPANPTVVSSGDITGEMLFQGLGTDGVYRNITDITTTVNGTPVGSFVPGDLSFSTSDTSAGLTERMRISYAGNVGIGTTSPTAAFAVGTGATSNFTVSSTGNVGIGASASITSLLTLSGYNCSGLGNGGTLTTDASGNVICAADDGGGGAITPWTSDIDADGYDLNDLSNILFRETTGAPAGTDVGLYRDNTGDLSANVLTGKTLNIAVNGTDEYNFSSTALELNSNNITGASAITASGLLTLSSNNNALLFSGSTPSISSGGNLLGIFAGGNVGIGTTGNVYAGLTVRGAGTTTGRTFTTYGSDLRQGLTVIDSGNVGIGTTNATSPLEISKYNTGQTTLLKLVNPRGSTSDTVDIDFIITGSTTLGRIGAIRTNTDTDGATDLTFSNYGPTANFSEKMRLTSAGNLGIGTSAVAGSKLQVNGGLALWPSTTAIALSSGSSLGVSGNVGIGVTTTSAKLQVYDTSNTAASFSLTNNTATTIGNGANTLGVLDLQSTSLTTGNFMNIELNALTAGKGINLTSSSTAFSTGTFLNLDWSPTSTTTATGDLVNIGIGLSGNIGNLLNIKDSNSSIFSVSESAFTTSLPTNFTSSGDVAVAYDLNFTNPTASYIKSAAPLYVQAGESFNSSDLTLRTYNSGQGVFDLAGGASLMQAQTWNLSSTTSINALTFSDSSGNDLLNLDTANTRVGIGVSNPGYRFEVDDNTASSYAAQFFNDGNNANRYGIQIQAGADDASGTTYYLNALDGDGGQVGYIANTAGSFALTDPSDVRLKTNIADTALNGLDIITSLRVADFNRISNPTGPTITGFIAQEVQGVFPQMVSEGPDGMLGISKETLIPVLVKAIQEQQSQIASVSAQLSSLTITSGGNVGIGTTNPTTALDVVGNTNISGQLTVNSLQTGIINLGAADSLLIKNSLGQNLFQVDASGSARLAGTITTEAGAFDVAEDYSAEQGVEPGDVVSISSPTTDYSLPQQAEDGRQKTVDSTTITKSSKPYDNTVIGVVSTKPALRLSENQISDIRYQNQPVALAGRVPVKVSTENGAIQKGDYLTSSSIPGVAMKATRPGQVIGKALESFPTTDYRLPQQAEDGSQKTSGKILVFVNISFADPGNFLSSLSLDDEGNLIVPKIKTASIALDPTIVNSSQLTVNSNSLAAANSDLAISSKQSTESYIDLGGKIASLEERITDLEKQLSDYRLQTTVNSSRQSAVDSQQSEATSSAQVKDLADELLTSSEKLVAEATSSATPSAALAEAEVLNLTPPDILLNQASAILTNLEVKSEATISGQLTAYNLNVQDGLKSLGATSLGNTTIAGDLTVDGTLSIENGQEINVLGTLYLQKSILATAVDIFNGLVTIDNKGNLTAQTITAEEIVTTKLTISTKPKEASSSATLGTSTNATIGSGKILAGKTKVAVFTNQITDTAKVFITLKSSALGQTPYVEATQSDTGFVVTIDQAVSRDIDFDWWIVETK